MSARAIAIFTLCFLATITLAPPLSRSLAHSLPSPPPSLPPLSRSLALSLPLPSAPPSLRRSVASSLPPSLPAPKELLAQATDLFNRGVELYDDQPEQARQLFTQAMIRYDAIVEHHHIYNTDLLLNLGNSAMLAEDTARAVLAYRRAQRLSPNHPRVQRNLAQARASVGVDLDPSAGARMREVLLAWRGVIPRSTLAAIALAGYLLLWTLAITRLLNAAPWSRTLLIPAAVATALSLALLLFEQTTIANSTDAVINQHAQALNGPSDGVYEPTFDHDLPPGVEVTILERRDDWARVKLIDARQTWVRLTTLSPI